MCHPVCGIRPCTDLCLLNVLLIDKLRADVGVGEICDHTGVSALDRVNHPGWGMTAQLVAVRV